MKKPKTKYIGWCHECKYLGSFHCGICQRENLSVKNFARLCLGLDIISPFGTKRWVTEIIANSVEFIERKASGGGAAASAGDKGGFETFGTAVPFDEEIPF